MVKQVSSRSQEPAVPALEEEVHRLEGLPGAEQRWALFVLW
jgi:hypothetical protein